ncbi:response regulator [bacterium AH-315-J23]|nr:response regulator [bacterium AH-315-J23]
MRKQIIIIDDDDAVRDSTHAFLECMGFNVNTFNSAKQFLRTGSYDSVCCFVVDVHMPEMTGVDFLERIHDTHPHLPVILVSGNISMSIRTRAEQAGAFAIFEKPFEQYKLSEILKTVCPFLENHSADQCT